MSYTNTSGSKKNFSLMPCAVHDLDNPALRERERGREKEKIYLTIEKEEGRKNTQRNKERHKKREREERRREKEEPALGEVGCASIVWVGND